MKRDKSDSEAFALEPMSSVGGEAKSAATGFSSRYSGNIDITLPWPPSINGYWRSGLFPTKAQIARLLQAARQGPKPFLAALRGLVPRVLLSEKGRAYREHALLELNVQGMTGLNLDVRLAVEMILHAPTKAVRDVDNYPKGVLDALKAANVLKDDSLIDDLRMKRGRVIRGGAVSIRISKITPKWRGEHEADRSVRRAEGMA